MAIEIPHEVAMFLNFVGVPYPDINEDQVRELAGHVRTFADEVAGTHASATGAISDMGAVYEGQSYRALVASWARLSSSHMEKLDELCNGVATALEIAAEVITAVKVAVLTELGLLAAAYATAMAATVATGGASMALGQSLSMAAKQLVKAMEQMLIAYILAEVLGKAIEPLEEAVGDMINGVVYDAAADLLGVDPGGNDVLRIDPDEVRRYAQVLDDHADDIMGHAEKFANNVAALDFTTPVGPAPTTPAQPGGVPPGSNPADSDRALSVGSPAQQPTSAPQQGAVPRNWIPDSGKTPETDSPGDESRRNGSGPGSGGPGGAGAQPEPATSAPPAGSPDGAGRMPSAAQAAGTPGADTTGAPGARSESVDRAGPDSGVTAGNDSPWAPATAVDNGSAGPAERVSTASSSSAVSPVDSAVLASSDGPAAAATEVPPANPWSRPAAAGPGGADAGSGKAAPRDSAGPAARAPRGKSARRRGSGKPNPWSLRPAGAGAEPSKTPWARPDRQVPRIPVVAAQGNSTPPSGEIAGPPRGPDADKEAVAVRPAEPVDVRAAGNGDDMSRESAGGKPDADGIPSSGAPARPSAKVPTGPPGGGAHQRDERNGHNDDGRPGAPRVSAPPTRDDGPPRI
ncbi:hypothetical protein [Nocardia sp. NPDC024068]|uniref:WXG100-like domain-containing protein n=1 Tax=Nocardia sp. NPDC024068 TaxID=3157197 RepID=UPI0034058323